MSNTFAAFYPDKETHIALVKSNVETCDEFLKHYDFVLRDLSSDITNKELEQKKEPAIEFLQAMRAEWQKCRDRSWNNLVELMGDDKR